MLSLLKKLLSSFWGGVWGAQKPPENLKIGILGGFGGTPKISQNKKNIYFLKAYNFLCALTVPATEDVAVQVRTPFKKKYFISGLTSKLNISNYSSLKNNEF